MNEPTVYAICMALVTGLLFIGRRVAEHDFRMLFSLPLMLTALLLGNRFNAFPRNLLAWVTITLSLITSGLLVALLAAVPYSLYHLAGWGVSWFTAAEAVSQVERVSPPAVALLRVNRVLWVLTVLLAGWALAVAVHSLRWIAYLTRTDLLTGYAIPLLMDGLTFYVLWVTRRHLLGSPGAAYAPVGVNPVAAGVLVSYLLYAQVQNLLHYRTFVRRGPDRPRLDVQIVRVMGLIQAVLLGYYLVQLFFFP